MRSETHELTMYLAITLVIASPLLAVMLQRRGLLDDRLDQPASESSWR